MVEPVQRVISEEEKRELYHTGQYVFKAPPVCTVYWTDKSWIDWITACRGWRPTDYIRPNVEALGYEWTPDPNNARMYIRGRKL